jgi:hypothetical protein
MRGFAAKRNEDGEFVAYPLELPLYDETTRALAQGASTNLTSALRHFAVVDAFIDNGLITDETSELVQQEFDMATEQLISTMCCLASIADGYGIDIMREILETPWTA